jgi:hypothetical protein
MRLPQKHLTQLTYLRRITPDAIYWRLDNGWSPEDAVKPSNNRSKEVTAFGKTQSLSAWAEEYNMKYSTLRARIAKWGLPIEIALKLPVKRNK